MIRRRRSAPSRSHSLVDIFAVAAVVSLSFEAWGSARGAETALLRPH